MPITLAHPLDLDAHERLVEVVADAKDPAAGTARFRLRELPHGKAKALLARRLSALAAYGEVGELIERLGGGKPLTEAEAEQLGAAIGGLHATTLALIRWAVCGHIGTDFIDRGAPVPFVGEDAHFLGKAYRVASEKDLALYASVGRAPGKPAGTLWSALARAVELFQEGKVEEPAEVWARASATPAEP